MTAGRLLLVAAVAAGVALRFYRLDAVSISADEGAAWAAAAEPLSHLLKLQPQLDAGKLAVYDLLLHYWMELCGDSLRALRGLSAMIDTGAIVLMFALLRELYQAMAGDESGRGELAGGIAALMFAINVTVVQAARTARMYPLMTAAELAQMFFFVRTQRYGGVYYGLSAAVLLAVAIAANFTALFLVAGEVSWLAYLLLARTNHWPGAELGVAAPAWSLVAGGAMLLPFAPAAVAVSRAAVSHGVLDWISYQEPLGWSYHLLRDDAGNKWLFRLSLGLAGFALWRYRGQARLAPMFLATITAAPFATVAVLSLCGRPLMVERYMLLGEIAFLAMAATGAAAFESTLARVLVLVLIVWLSARALRHSSAFWVDWRQAVEIACVQSPANATIGVVPGYAVNAVRYQLPVARRALAVGVNSPCGNSSILIVSPGRPLAPSHLAELRACYPRVLGRATRVEVRAR